MVRGTVDESQLNHVVVDVAVVSVSLRLWVVDVCVGRALNSDIWNWRFGQENSSIEHAVVSVNDRLHDSVHQRVVSVGDESQAGEVVQHVLMVTAGAAVSVCNKQTF